MTSPKLARLELWGVANAFSEARAYRDPRDGKQYPSVTSVLKGVPKDLTQYAANEMLKFCIENWQDLGRKSDDQALKSYKYMWRKHADLRGHVGDGIHNYIEMEQTGGWDYPDLDDEQEQILENWHELNEKHVIEPILNEVTVGDTELGWMGTFDSYCIVDGIPTIVDFKTSKSIWDSAYMQLAALMNAKEWFIEVEDMKWDVVDPMPAERAQVFHLRADKWEVRTVPDLEEYYGLYCLYLEQWKIRERLKALNKARDTPK